MTNRTTASCRPHKPGSPSLAVDRPLPIPCAFVRPQHMHWRRIFHGFGREALEDYLEPGSCSAVLCLATRTILPPIRGWEMTEGLAAPQSVAVLRHFRSYAAGSCRRLHHPSQVEGRIDQFGRDLKCRAANVRDLVRAELSHRQTETTRAFRMRIARQGSQPAESKLRGKNEAS